MLILLPGKPMVFWNLLEALLLLTRMGKSNHHYVIRSSFQGVLLGSPEYTYIRGLSPKLGWSEGVRRWLYYIEEQYNSFWRCGAVLTNSTVNMFLVVLFPSVQSTWDEEMRLFQCSQDAAIAKNSFRYGETLGHAMATLDSCLRTLTETKRCLEKQQSQPTST